MITHIRGSVVTEVDSTFQIQTFDKMTGAISGYGLSDDGIRYTITGDREGFSSLDARLG